jgi:hypothetical protein
MRDDKPDQFVDDLFEASLKQYRGEEPRSGLEMRILAGVRTRERAARRRWLGWAAAVCAGILAVIALTLHFARAPLRQPTPSASLSSKGSGTHRAPLRSATPPATVSQLQPGLRLRGSGGPAHGPKEKPGVRATKRPEQFPTPYPLTEQEKLLLAYLNKATKPDLTVETDEIPIDRLEVPEISVAALNIRPLDDSQSEQEK